MNSKYAGMTVNERLYVAGLMDEFDEAVEGDDTKKIIAILRMVDLTEDSIAPILDELARRSE